MAKRFIKGIKVKRTVCGSGVTTTAIHTILSIKGGKIRISEYPDTEKPTDIDQSPSSYMYDLDGNELSQIFPFVTTKIEPTHE
jgi:hypothetical protein